MEPITQSTKSPRMDIHLRKPGTHPSRRWLIASSTILIVLAIVLIALEIKAKRDYEAYLKTPEGQIWLLKQAAKPITKTPQDRADDLSALQQNSSPVTATSEERMDTLTKLSQQQ